MLVRMRKLASLALIAFTTACQTAPVAASGPTPTSGQQWAYGSAEGSVVYQQIWQQISRYVVRQLNSGHSVVLAPDSTIAEPRFLKCGDKPPAAVFDADETLIFNLGAMGEMLRLDTEFDPVIWDQWEKTGAGKAVATPGALDALEDLRAVGVAIIVNTNRSNTNPNGTVETLRAAGLGDYVYGETLFLRGDTPDGSGKDGRRAIISENYCVIALVGDQLGDIADAFNDNTLTVTDRRKLVTEPRISHLWGNGWFIMPNPMYGPSIEGDMRDVFPESSDWTYNPAGPVATKE